MPKKKSLPTLSTLQSGIDELQITLKSLVRQINDRFNGVDKRFNQAGKNFVGINERFKRIDKRFDKLEIQMDKRFNEQADKFVKWKNELFTKIDNNYAKPIKDLQEEDAAKEFRLEDHETRISKLEKPTFIAA